MAMYPGNEFTIDQPERMSVKENIFNDFAREEIATYSCEQDNGFLPNESQKRYLHLPPNIKSVEFDLMSNLDTFVEADYLETINKIIRCLKYIGREENDGQDPEIVCRRGVLSLIMRTPYVLRRQKKSNWCIKAMKYKNRIFLSDFEEPKKLVPGSFEEMNNKKYSYPGYKFEQYVTKQTPGDVKTFAQQNEDVNTWNVFYTLTRATLGKHILFYAGEVDGCDPESEGGTYIECKTAWQGFDKYHRPRKEHEGFLLLRWWLQSVLVNVSKIVCGVRDKDAKDIIGKIQMYNIEDLPYICKGWWHPDVCFSFLDQFLNFVKTTLADKPENPKVVHMFRSDLTNALVRYEELPPGSELCFLPEWFCAEK